MLNPEKLSLMARLAILEQNWGRQIRKSDSTSRIDLVTNPVWRWGFLITLLFFIVAGALAVLNMDMVMDAVAKDLTKNLIMFLLIADLSTLAVTIVIASVCSLARARRMREVSAQYHEMLLALERINEMERRDTGRSYSASFEDDQWEDSSDRSRRRRAASYDEEDLDYRNMQVLEFEDDDYCYYVEAVPKKRR